MELKMFQKIIYFTLIIGLGSCWTGSSKISDKVTGTYSFEFPRGDYQILEINKDSSFLQKFYIDKKKFKENISPFYINKGIWSIYNNNELEFTHWLKYCNRRNPDSILAKPKQVTMLNIYWNRATRKRNSYISIFSETGYYFVKMNSSSGTRY